MPTSKNKRKNNHKKRRKNSGLKSSNHRAEPSSVTQLRETLSHAFSRDQAQLALATFAQLVRSRHYEKQTSTPQRVEDLLAVGRIYFNMGKYSEAGDAFENATKLDTSNHHAFSFLGASWLRSGDINNALLALTTALECCPNPEHETTLLDGLAHAYGANKDHELASKYGTLSLQDKDRQVVASSFSPENQHLISDLTTAKPLATEHPERNIISFSLFGHDSKYCETAVLNAELAGTLYPGWCCRFYCAVDVPKAVIHRLEQLGEQVILMPDSPADGRGLFWRFHVASDPQIDRFLVRDCDSLINIRESAAVREWLTSDCKFHLMRDYYSHSELILAGMWGGIGGVFLDIQAMIERFLAAQQAATANVDQQFLRESVWPTIRASVLSHDSCFSFLDASPFPSGSELEAGQNVGKNIAVPQISATIQAPDDTLVEWTILDDSDAPRCSYTVPVKNNRWSSNIPLPLARKLEAKTYRVVFKLKET